VIFIDTGPLYALTIPGDAHHESATAWYQTNTSRLVTTDFVLYETVTLLRRRRQYDLAVEVGDRLFANQLADIEWVTRDDIHASWKIFRDYNDKEWSFTDCTSRIVMERLGVTEAFSFDEHFRQFGTVMVVP